MLPRMDVSNKDLLVSRSTINEGTLDAMDVFSTGISVTKLMEPSDNVTTSASSIKYPVVKYKIFICKLHITFQLITFIVSDDGAIVVASLPDDLYCRWVSYPPYCCNGCCSNKNSSV